MRVQRILAIGALVLASCEVRDHEQPAIDILTPENDGTLPQNGAVVIVDIDRFTLDREVFPPPLAGGTEYGEPFHGHWHLYVGPPDSDLYFSHFLGDQFDEDARVHEALPLGRQQITVVLVAQNHDRIASTPIRTVQIEVVP